MMEERQTLYPLRVEEIPAGVCEEWRADQIVPETVAELWQLVYVRSGTAEERCDGRRHLLRPGGVLLHQPGERYAMLPVGQWPPEVLRVDFVCTSAAMDLFRGRFFHADPIEQAALNLVAETVRQVFLPPQTPDERPPLRPDLPFGVQQQLAICLENALILLARRSLRTRKPGPRWQGEQREAALVERARGYFAQNLCRELRVQEVCEALGCTRAALQKAFRARRHHGPMEEFAALRLEYAAQLLARGAMPGEVAGQLGYRSGAYFSQRFKAATGNTPSEYRRLQQNLPAHRQQKDKA